MNQAEEQRKKQESEILKLLERDPQKGMAMAIEHYTGLIWTVAGQYLSNPEDIKECVNDTFLELFLHRNRYDSDRGSLAVFLGGIARNRAVSLYRKNRRHESRELSENCIDSKNDYLQTEDRLDLEQAINTLKPEDAEIIRLHYYNGMSVQEIAASMNLPYETVKKRHQRSLAKMRLLLLTVLILLLAAGLIACAYAILQHFGVIPGYGVNKSGTIPFYVLEETVAAEGEEAFTQLTNAVMSEDTLVLTVIMELKDPRYKTYVRGDDIQDETFRTEPTIYNPCLILEDGTVYSELYLVSTGPASMDDMDDMSRKKIEIIFEPMDSIPWGNHPVPMTLKFSDIELPFVFSPIQEEPLEEYSYELTDQGGVLAIPSLENGRLYVEIYPLNCGMYKIEPGLIRCHDETIGGPREDIRAVGPDGNVLTGTCLFYSPYSSHAFYRWDFGPAQAGEYVLEIPYVYQTAPVPEDFFLTVSDDDPHIGLRLEIPGSVLTITSYTSEVPEGTDFEPFGEGNEHLQRFLLFDVETEDTDRIFTSFTPCAHVTTESDGQPHYGIYGSLYKISGSQKSYLGKHFQLPEGYEKSPVEIFSDARSLITYRWNHSFSLTLHVTEEEK